MNALHEDNNQDALTETQPAPEVAASAPHPIAPPGRPLSFEEALTLTMEKYDNALRELAK